MADTGKLEPIQPEPQSRTIIVSPVGAAVEAAKDLIDKVPRWSPQQVVVIGCVCSMVVTNGLLVWATWDARNDRRDERAAHNTQIEYVTRATEDARERDRQFIALERDRDRSHCRDTNRDVLTHCALENEKDRKALAAFAAAVSAALNKKAPPDPVLDLLFPNVSPTVAPMPRLKAAPVSSASAVAAGDGL